MDDPVKIAKGLTKAQRATVRTISGALDSNHIALSGAPVMMISLAGLGIVYAIPLDGYHHVTPLGRAVAEALKEMQDG